MLIDFSAWGQSDLYTVQNGSYPFSVTDDFPHDGASTLRSYNISNSGTSDTTIKFTLLMAGSISFFYYVGSESNYDWLRITIDGTEVIKKSGVVDWTQYTQELAAGEHTVVFKYTTDSSNLRNGNVGAIADLNIRGFAATKYIVGAGSSYYDGDGTAKDIAELTAAAFTCATKPTGEFLETLENPVVYAHNAEEVVSGSVTIHGSPPLPQVMTTVQMGHGKQVDSITADKSDDAIIELSFDNGETWISSNFPATTTYCLRVTLPTVDSYAKNIIIKYK